MRAKTSLWILIAVLGVLPVACGKGSGAGASPPSGIRLDGAIGDVRTWTVEQLATLPLQTQDVSFQAEGAQKSLRGRGVLLLDLLQRAKPKFDPKKKRDSLRHAVLVHAVDGYEAVVSWGEIDPEFAGNPVIVTVDENDKRLDRPGMIVPGDKHGGRHVDAIDRISLVAVRAS
jgi:DMSO/TMAO reductase YedYZ molybdopterin-dependent catalytic subunit